jgi:pilus assembly protein Flp/PilA
MNTLREAFEFLELEFFPRFKNFVAAETGQDLIEYALVAALVALVAVAAVKGLSNKIGNTTNAVGNGLTSAT